jgi:hypothetical protein
MKKVLKLLNSNKRLLKEKSIKLKIGKMNILFKKYSIKFPIKNELDYYNACLTYQGIVNKEVYEKVYEDNRQDLIELWNTLDRNKRNFFSNKALDEYRKLMPCFYIDKEIYRMPMLEKLFNRLYEKELAILELPQYFKFKNDFNNQLIDPFNYYFDLPFKNDFIDVDFVYSDRENLALFEKVNNSLFIINKNRSIVSIGLSNNIKKFEDIEFVKSVIEKDENKLLMILNDNKYIDNNLLAKINKNIKR